MATKKGYLKQKTGANTSDIMLPHTSADIVALSENIQFVYQGENSNVNTTVNNVQDWITHFDASTKAAINAGGTGLSNHISDTSNPHSVTKAQVGLGNVENVAQLRYDSTGTDQDIAVFSTSGNNLKVKRSGVSLTTLQNIAQGATKTFVIDSLADIGGGGFFMKTGSAVATTDSSNASMFYQTKSGFLFANMDHMIASGSFTTISGASISRTQLKVGDVILSARQDEPDLWVSSVSSSDFMCYFLESRNLNPTDFAAASHNHDDAYVQKNANIESGTKCKITYDAKGLVTGGSDLAASDIPYLAASKINSGTFADARIASASTWNAKYAKPSGGIPSSDLATTGVSAGTYSAVTVNTKGQVTSGGQFFAVGTASDVVTGGLFFEVDS